MGRKKQFNDGEEPIIKLLNITDICKLAGISYQSFKRMEHNFPTPIMVGNLKVWRKEAVEKYLLKLGM